MSRCGFLAIALLLIGSSSSGQSKLSTKWEELTGPDFRAAIQQAKGTCLLPFGILEKHGPHLPLGTDLLNVRYVTLQAAEQEYAVVFPEYYFGQIFEAKHEPGTIAYSTDLQLKLLQETTDEMARNGCKKIVIVNGHGGNNHLIPYFAQSQLEGPRDYVVYTVVGGDSQQANPLKKDKVDLHAGQTETSVTMISWPNLVHLDRVSQESGASQDRTHLPENLYTGIWWYAKFPDHYAGDASLANREYGEAVMKQRISGLVERIRSVKADDQSLKLQNEFYEKSKHPRDTQQ